MRASADCPQVFEVAAAIFDLLGSLNDWTDLPGHEDGGSELSELVEHLEKQGLIEVRG
jgi:hypothetical protein